MKFKDWLETFLEEKKVPNKTFTIEFEGNTHIINSEQVIDLIRQASHSEQVKIKDILVKIDFKNGDINHFLEHLAKGYLSTHFKKI